MFVRRSRFPVFERHIYWTYGRYPWPQQPRSSTVTELELDVTDLATIELTNIEEALALIDKGLGGLTERQLVSASEVTDLLLDVRSVLSETAPAS